MVISGFEVEQTMSLLVFYSILRHFLSFYVVLCGCFKVMSLVEILPKQARTSYIAFCYNNPDSNHLNIQINIYTILTSVEPCNPIFSSF